MVSFQEGSELLKELAGVVVDAKQVERTAEALGKEIAEDERCHMEPSDTLPLPKTLYLGMDGTGIPLRAEELAGTTGKQPDGSAKTREVKLCTVWSAESLDEHGIPVRDQGSVTYSAALESASASARLSVPWRLGMVPPGSGTWPRNCFPGRSKSWTASTPSST
jgi:hypothetical protein